MSSLREQCARDIALKITLISIEEAEDALRSASQTTRIAFSVWLRESLRRDRSAQQQTITAVKDLRKMSEEERVEVLLALRDSCPLLYSRIQFLTQDAERKASRRRQ